MTCRVSIALILMALTAAAPARATGEDSPAPAYVVVVDYSTDAQNFAALRSLIDGVARATIAEPGCRGFDVVAPANASNHLLLYEVFDDAAAFQAHAASPHFKQFVADSAKLGATRVATPGFLVVSLRKP